MSNNIVFRFGGVARCAEYHKDNAGKTFQRKELIVEAANELTDVIDVLVCSCESKDNLEAHVILLTGSADEISALVQKDMPASPQEEAAIIRYLSTADQKAATSLAYILGPRYHTARNSPLYSELRSCLSLILSDMYSIPRERITVLDLEEE